MKEQEAFEKKALDPLFSGKRLFGKEGAFAPLRKGCIAEALAEEMATHLRESQRKTKAFSFPSFLFP